MNIQNIAALTEKLVATGFNENIGRRLLQYVCFRPADFILTEHLAKDKDVLTCTLFFERKGDDYVCSFYDASFLKETEMPDISVQGIHLRELDKRMSETEWQLKESGNGSFNLNNEASWEREKRIEGIVTDLSRLSATDEGKRFADALKLKYWAHIPLHPMMGNINALKSRFEVCQRFYFYDGQGISVDEAYRFLLNRWLEKKLQARKKQPIQEGGMGNVENGSATANENGLLLKKRKTRTQKIKR